MRYIYLFFYYVSYTKLNFLIKDTDLKKLIDLIEKEENYYLIIRFRKKKKLNIKKYFDKYKFNTTIALKILKQEI